MKYLLHLLLLLSFSAGAQVTIQSDTTPVWIVFLDSVRVFAAYPGVDMQTDVVAGWRIITIRKEGFDFLDDEQYFDINGVKFDPDMVLFCKRRKINYNAFRQ